MTAASYRTFLGLEPESCLYDGARVALLPIPYDATASYRAGARDGPAAILDASTQVELFDLELGREPWRVGIHTLAAVEPTAAGPGAMVAAIEEAARQPVADGKLVIGVGGEHSVTLGTARAVAGRTPELDFLVIDAHLDLRDSYEGTEYSHACVSRRLLDLGRVVHVGPRVGCPEELEVIRQRGLDPIWGHELAGSADHAWIQRALDQLGPRVYVSVDVDGLDPSVIPGTGTPVPGGLGWYDALALLRAVGAQREVVGADLCELAPVPGQPASEFAASLLLYKMIGYFTR